jgi:uncharacterized delta-60 repeat protein
MRLLSWLRSLTPRADSAHARRTPPHPTFRPRLEVLEDRITPTGGLLDPTFGSGGIVNLPQTTDISARDVVVQPDGKVVIAGESPANNGNYVATVQRLNSNGTLDTTFNGTGSVTIRGAEESLAVALQPDGKILVGGEAQVVTIHGGSAILAAAS